ncbi:MAG: adenylate kinase [Candidatus Omnitrophota bacterium]
MKIILFGAPGSGKGTQAVVMSDYWHLKKISLGDILREEVKQDSNLGKEVKQYMEKGLLVPDELVSRLIEEHITSDAFILDGYPRNLHQATVLEGIFKKKGITVDAFIYLEVDEKAIVDRLSQRRVCKNCGTNYHLKNMPSKKDGICDACGHELIQRKDDTSAVIKKRWEVFITESKSILDFYKAQDKLVAVDGRGNKDEVFARVKNKLS